MATASDYRTSTDSTITLDKATYLDSSTAPLITSTDAEGWHKNRTARASHRLYRFVLCGLAVFAFALICWTAFQTWKLQKHVHLFPTGIELGTCGSNKTIEEARAHGCVFDPMSYIWVRPECYHEDLLDDFMKRNDWAWYSDPKLQNKIPMEQLFRGDHPQAFAPRSYHQIHCTYMWRKMHGVLLDHLPIDSDLSHWKHTMHCEKVLLNHILHEDANCTANMICPTLVRATWTTCGYY
ncbi:hypothetical protein BT63DRAFT_460948 [Microthyrium microscopicum]|uniref:Uncharacterized protein n=1 Tax=Microthyrium microscopicum TaxID=703497 RepID=A0A6A6TWH7_9PEZI|nr:hypothetical protein BT63DRAFT_460948 [Microthyrium microscopicum]